jgi:hypothetical protein
VTGASSGRLTTQTAPAAPQIRSAWREPPQRRPKPTPTAVEIIWISRAGLPDADERLLRGILGGGTVLQDGIGQAEDPVLELGHAQGEGVAIIISLGQVAGEEIMYFGLIPAGVGLAFLIYYLVEGRKEAESLERAPGATVPTRTNP